MLVAAPAAAEPTKDTRQAALLGLAAYARSGFKKLDGKTRTGGSRYEWSITSRPRFLGRFGRVDQIAVRSKNNDGGFTIRTFDITRRRNRGHTMLKERTTRHYGVSGQPLGEAVTYRTGMGRSPVRCSADNRPARLGRWMSVQIKSVRRAFRRRR